MSFFDPSRLPVGLSSAAALLTGGFDTKALRDGTVGYLMRGPDDCYAAAIATVLQTRFVPYFEINARLRRGMKPARVQAEVTEEIEAFLADWDLREVWHDTPPFESERWVGIVPMPGFAQDHCMVMSGSELLHDVADGGQALHGVLASVGVRVKKWWAPGDVKSGITFEDLERV